MLGLGKRSYFQHINPRGAISDFREVFRQAGKNRWRIAFASLAITAVLFWTLTKDSWRVPPPRPEITYINSWPLDRTAAETRKFIRKNQAIKDEQEALRKRTEEETKELYRQLGRISGMDVEKIEREAKQREAAEQAGQQAPVGQR